LLAGLEAVTRQGLQERRAQQYRLALAPGAIDEY